MDTPTPILQSGQDNATKLPTMGKTIPLNATETMPSNTQETMPPEPEPEIDIATVLEVVATQSNLGNLTAVAAFAHFQNALCVYCNYTVFAPTDDAFGKLNADLLVKLMSPAWLAHLRHVLANHATTPQFGAVLAKDLVNSRVEHGKCNDNRKWEQHRHFVGGLSG
jgi:uncharacterized surface protein with fasciclin (FAS1) repeats